MRRQTHENKLKPSFPFHLIGNVQKTPKQFSEIMNNIEQCSEYNLSVVEENKKVNSL